MMNWNGFGRKRSWPNFKVLFQRSPEVTEEKHENRMVSGPRSEPVTSRIQSRRVNINKMRHQKISRYTDLAFQIKNAETP
jgi:hypothetical protein